MYKFTMQYPNIALALLALPAALALPSNNHGHYHHHHSHETYQSGQPSAPFPSDTVGAPYGLSNNTASAAGTAAASNHYKTFTLLSTIYQTAGGADSSAPVESATAAGGSDSSACGSTSTVTHNPTTTVYVTGNGAPAESGTESSAPVIASSAAPETSAPVESETAAPVSSAPAESESVPPVVSSPAPAPKTSEAPAPTQAQSSASVAPSVTPVQSTPAAPANSAQSTAAPSPTVAASSPASMDYCSDLTPTTATVINPWHGANYTGAVAGQKKGIVFVAGINDADTLTYMATNHSDEIHWLGNYYSGPPSGFPSDWTKTTVEYVPQMYGRASDGDWAKNGPAMLQKGAKHFMSFGEPGTPNPTNHDDPDSGAQRYMDQMQKYTTEGVSIGAPGCLGGPQDWQWDQSFLCKCQGLGCTIDFIAGHWFDAAAPLEQQLARAKDTVETYVAVARGKPVWMDNIWAKGTAEEQIAFINAMVPWLEQHPSVQRYGWVSQDLNGLDNAFVHDDGSVSDIGKAFINAK